MPVVRGKRRLSGVYFGIGPCIYAAMRFFIVIRTFVCVLLLKKKKKKKRGMGINIKVNAFAGDGPLQRQHVFSCWVHFRQKPDVSRNEIARQWCVRD